MNLNQAIYTAASAYADQYILEYWDRKKGVLKNNPIGGDSLAQFIAGEIAGAYDCVDEALAFGQAVKALKSAKRDVELVIIALENARREES